MLPVKEGKLKYAVNGYAPGSYQNRCCLCDNYFLGDKRAVRCYKCATEELFVFDPKIVMHTPFAEHILVDEIKNEPMFFNSSLEYAYKHGGDITKSFIDSLPYDWTVGKTVFDSRVHMLMPGWYPAIPGWHHDDVPRQEIPVGQHFITAGQPQYQDPRYKSEHIMGLVNGDICPTEFITDTVALPMPSEGELVYRMWHPIIERLVADGVVAKMTAPSNMLIEFDCNTFHTGVKAISNGWRWFGRISRNTDRVNKVTNEIRRQAQVYLEFPMEGW